MSAHDDPRVGGLGALSAKVENSDEPFGEVWTAIERPRSRSWPERPDASRVLHDARVEIWPLTSWARWCATSVGTLPGESDRLIAPFGAQVALWSLIPGVDRRVDECQIGDIGLHVGRFDTSALLASWVGCGSGHESGAKSKSGRTRRGSKASGQPRPGGRSRQACPGHLFRRPVHHLLQPRRRHGYLLPRRFVGSARCCFVTVGMTNSYSKFAANGGGQHVEDVQATGLLAGSDSWENFAN
jgi:hypothetical protein